MSCEYPTIEIELKAEPRYGGVLSVPVVDGALTATWQQIKDAVSNGGVMLTAECEDDDCEGTVTVWTVYEVGEYYVKAQSGALSVTFSAGKATNKPTLEGPASDKAGTGEVDFMTLQE